jgi:pimeloyl-ACP methyl ester carboxylesterase
MHAIHYRYADFGGQQLFYREAGPSGAPAVVLLHRFPASSFMFRDLIPLLAGRYHVIAPDHLGFGLSGAPPAGETVCDGAGSFVHLGSGSRVRYGPVRLPVTGQPGQVAMMRAMRGRARRR